MNANENNPDSLLNLLVTVANKFEFEFHSIRWIRKSFSPLGMCNEPSFFYEFIVSIKAIIECIYIGEL